MAPTSSLRASSTPPWIPRWRYDIFLSFRGEDTRRSFTDHLYAALVRGNGIIVFRDDEKLERGNDISEELLKAIEESMCAVVVISENYAFSKWCLIELAKIVECRRQTGLKVLPVFYHARPTDVQYQKGSFANAFARHREDPEVDEQEIITWRAALRKVANLGGWVIDDNCYESKIVKKIVQRIDHELHSNGSLASKLYFVGLESRLVEVMKLLDIGEGGVCFMGIHGMGGVGKTKLANVIYHVVYPQFEFRCFLCCKKDSSRRTRYNRPLNDLRKQLISDLIFKGKEMNILDDGDLISVISSRLRHRKVFLVLDDVDIEQIQALAWSPDLFGWGSRIILTSRDVHLLNRHATAIYEVKMLNDHEALKLFSWHAFKQPYPKENYKNLSWKFVTYAQGLPLALINLGSYLFRRKRYEWKSFLDRIQVRPMEIIIDQLRSSFDGLDALERGLFLDIACFFQGSYLVSIIHKLESFGYFPNSTIPHLRDKSLLAISRGRLVMHGLIEKMGQQIVEHEDKHSPGNRSRLWHWRDVLYVLQHNKGTERVQAMVLDFPNNRKKKPLRLDAFSNMKRLRMLKIGNIGCVENVSELYDKLSTLVWRGELSTFVLSDELRILEWCGCPLKSLPTSFEPDKLVELSMPFSPIEKLWKGVRSLEDLKIIDLRGSQNLIETPDFTEVPSLERLELEGCTSLSKLHPSIGFLKCLKRLNLRNCKRLKSLPDLINLESLEFFDLSGCSSLKTFPAIVGNMTSLWMLKLDGTAIEQLPLSFERLSGLEILSLENCKNLSFFPRDISCLSSLEIVNLSGNVFARIPDCICQLSNLESLYLRNCIRLQALPKLPLSLTYLYVENCPLLEMFSDQIYTRALSDILVTTDCSLAALYIDYDGGSPCNILQLDLRTHLQKEGYWRSFFGTKVICGSSLGPGIPKWFNNKSASSSVKLEMHPDLNDNRLWKGCAMFVVYEVHESTDPTLYHFVYHFETDEGRLHIPFVLPVPKFPSVGPTGFWVYIPAKWFLEQSKKLDGWSYIEALILTDSSAVEVKECGMRLVCSQHDASEFYKALNIIAHGLDLETYHPPLYRL